MKRSAPLQRRAPLRRLQSLRTKRKTKYRQRQRDTDYMAWVRRQPCSAKGMGTCSGRVEADHTGKRGVGQKADDRTCIPLCHKHHVQRTSFSGPFRSWNQEAMRVWLAVTLLQIKVRRTDHIANLRLRRLPPSDLTVEEDGL